MAWLKLALAIGTYYIVRAQQTIVDQVRLEEGKKHYDLIQKQSEMPRFGTCWKGAMSLIHTECKHLTDIVQARLALAYLNCFLQIQGRAKYVCDENVDVQTCVQGMTEADSSSFATFFTHTQNICYFLQAQIWQEGTENTINKLSATSSQVADQLETSHKLQEVMITSQNQSLKNQEELIHQAHSLNDIIVNSSHNVKTLFEDLKQSTNEQREIIGDLFHQLNKLQNTILGEVSGFYSLIHYVASIFVCYMLSSTPRTAGSRVWLFLIMTVNVLMEQTVMRWINTIYSTSADNELLYWLQRSCRRVTIIFGIITWLLCAYLYKDINALNNQLLVEIRKQNSDLQKFFTGQAGSLLSAERKSVTQQEEEESTDSDYTSDVSDDDGSGSGSDKTFVFPENTTMDDDLTSWVTLKDSELREKEKASLLMELSDLQKDLSMSDPHSRITSWLDKANSSKENIESRTPAGVPQANNLVSPYNLRLRKPASGPTISPATRFDSAKSFSKTVSNMQQIAEKNSQLIRAFHQVKSPHSKTEGSLTLTLSDDISCDSSRSSRSRKRLQ